MEDLKLYLVSHMGGLPCFRLVVAKSKEEAFLDCYNREKNEDISSRSSCLIEEVKVDGYEIIIRKVP
ncbi:MAG: hypothetical protein AB1756_08870 [Acidobacteriota bacterium]